MLESLVLTAALLVPMQTAGRPQPTSPTPTPPSRPIDWSLSVQLERGVEMLYRGSFTEECTTGSVQYQRQYRVESRILVLDANPKACELACMTTLRAKEAANQPVRPVGFKDETDGRAIRIERFRVDGQGKVSSAAAVDLVPPLDGPATAEVGYFAEMPRGRITSGQTWQTTVRAGEPAMTWSVADTDTVQGVRCPVLKGVQQSADWDQPRGDRKAWRRTDTVWVAPRTGVALRVERVIEVREPAHKEPTQRSVFHADLESTLPYPGNLFVDRQADIVAAIGLREAVRPLLATPGRYTAQLTALLKRITSHTDQTPPTPYRQAILQVKAQAEAALRGEVLVTPTSLKPRTGLVVGEPAPDFVTRDTTGKQSIGLKQLRGKPAVLAFYNPNSTLTPDLLRFLGDVATTYPGQVSVLPLSVVEDAEVVQKQMAEMKLNLPVLYGSGLRISYEVDTTPRVVVIDSQGYVRGAYTGWGRDLPRDVLTDLKPWLEK